MLLCSCTVSQESSTQAEGEIDDTNQQSINDEESQALRKMRLEKTLVDLSAVIEDTPSRFHHDRAEVLFRLGRYRESISDYNMATQYGRPHNDDSCWERGLAQYYAGDFHDGQEQFSRYNRVGRSDIENGLWRFLCIAEVEGVDKAREVMLEYPRRTRKPFPALLDLYMGNGSVDAVLEEANSDNPNPRDLTNRLFYGHYYIGKHYEITKQYDRALAQIRDALKYEIRHFMYACAEADVKRLDERRLSEVPEE